jgi:hypothetical protein
MMLRPVCQVFSNTALMVEEACHFTWEAKQCKTPITGHPISRATVKFALGTGRLQMEARYRESESDKGWPNG